MPKRKHVKKNLVAPCTDTNQHVIESNKERLRVLEAKRKRFEKLREEYLKEVKRKQDMAEGKAPTPVIKPVESRDPVND